MTPCPHCSSGIILRRHGALRSALVCRECRQVRSLAELSERQRREVAEAMAEWERESAA